MTATGNANCWEPAAPGQTLTARLLTTVHFFCPQEGFCASPASGSEFAGAQVLTLLSWSVLKHVWNTKCFAKSTPKPKPVTTLLVLINLHTALRLHSTQRRSC